MGRLKSSVETLANVSIILVAVLLSIVLVRNYLLKPIQPSQVAAMRAPSLKGEKLQLQNANWDKASQTLVFALQKGCKFCSDSSSFYKKITNDDKIRSKTHLLAIFPHSVDLGRQYLTELSLPIEDLRQEKLANLKVSGTPALMLVDSNGVVTESWMGKLSPEKENEILSKLQ